MGNFQLLANWVTLISLNIGRVIDAGVVSPFYASLYLLYKVLSRNLNCQLFSNCPCHCLMTSSSQTLAKNSHWLSLAYMLCSVNNVGSVETYINNFESRPSQRLLVSVTR